MEKQVAKDLFLEFRAILTDSIKKSIKPQRNKTFQANMSQKHSNLTIFPNTLGDAQNDP
jgi:hypothetical protein